MRLAVGLFLSVVVGVAQAGCDEQIGEREARLNVAKGHELALAGTEESAAEVRQLLEKAGASTEATPATRANAKALLAQLELDQARAAQRQIDRKMMDVTRLISEISQLGNQIATTNALIAGYRTYDPREPVAAIEKAIADATGGPDNAAWFTHDDSQIPTLNAVQQEIARLDAEIAQRREKLTNLTTQRGTTLAEAEQAAKQSEGTSSNNLAAFRRASDLRKQAADLATQTAALEASIHPMERDLAIARGQEQVINYLIKALQSQAQSLQSGWQAIQQQIQAQTSLANNIVGGGSAGAGDSIANKATELEKVIGELSALREPGVESARNAASHYGEAVQHAEELRREVSELISNQPNRSEQKGWQLLRDVMQPGAFRLEQAAAERMLAMFFASQGRELKMRMDLRTALTPILERAGLALPDVLAAANLERELETVVGNANEAYQKSNELLESVTEGAAPPEIQNAAYVARILTLYGWSNLDKQAGNETAASEHLELAKQVRNSAVDRSLALPALPPGLGEPPKPAPETPAEPATAPSDAPAEAPAESPPATEPAAAPDEGAAPPETPADPSTSPG